MLSSSSGSRRSRSDTSLLNLVEILRILHEEGIGLQMTNRDLVFSSAAFGHSSRQEPGPSCQRVASIQDGGGATRSVYGQDGGSVTRSMYNQDEGSARRNIYNPEGRGTTRSVYSQDAGGATRGISFESRATSARSLTPAVSPISPPTAMYMFDSMSTMTEMPPSLSMYPAGLDHDFDDDDDDDNTAVGHDLSHQLAKGPGNYHIWHGPILQHQHQHYHPQHHHSRIHSQATTMSRATTAVPNENESRRLQVPVNIEAAPLPAASANPVQANQPTQNDQQKSGKWPIVKIYVRLLALFLIFLIPAAVDDFFILESNTVAIVYLTISVFIFIFLMFCTEWYSWKPEPKNTSPPIATRPVPSQGVSIPVDPVIAERRPSDFNVTPRCGTPLVPRRRPSIELMLGISPSPPPRYSSLSLNSPSPQPPDYAHATGPLSI